jgi:hypothetical protein
LISTAHKASNYIKDYFDRLYSLDESINNEEEEEAKEPFIDYGSMTVESLNEFLKILYELKD